MMKSKFQTQKLGDLITEVSIRNNKKVITEVFSVTNSEGFVRSTDYFDKEVFSKNISNYKIVSPNQFAYNPSRINVGSIDFLKEDFEVIISPLYVAFKCSNQLLPDYLLRYIKSPLGISQIRKKTQGAVRDNLTFESLSSIDIPVPSITDQTKLIKLFSKIEVLIEKQKKSTLLLDALQKSTFTKMFGSPLDIRKKKLSRLGDHISFLTSGSRGWAKYYSTEGAKFLRIQNLEKGTLNLDDIISVSPPKGAETTRTRVQGGDLLISITADIGRTAIVPENLGEAYISQHLALVRLKPSLNSIYTANFLCMPFGISEFNKKSRSAVKAGLNFDDLRDFPLLVPSLKSQSEFSRVVEKIKSLEKINQSLLKDLQSLYFSLYHKGFIGELDLNNIELDHIIPRSKGGNETNENIDITTKTKNRKIADKKGSILKVIVEKHFKGKTFCFEDLAEKIQASLIEEEYDYNKIKEGIFDALKSKGEIALKQVFNEKEKKILLQTSK